MALLLLNGKNLYDETAQYLYNGDCPSVGDTLATVSRCVNNGYRSFLQEEEWTELNVYGELSVTSGSTATDLPAAHCAMAGNFSLNILSPMLRETSVDEILRMRAWSNTTQVGVPQYYAVRTKGMIGDTGYNRYEVIFYPLPGSAYTLKYHYSYDPPSLTGASAQYPIGGVKYSMAILYAALAQAEARKGLTNGVMLQRYMLELQKAKARDAANQPQNLGPMLSTEPAQLPYQWWNEGQIVQYT